MKKIACMLLAALLLLIGCQAPGGGNTETAEITETTETTMAPTVTTVPEEETTVPIRPTQPIITPTYPGESLAFANPGKTRIAYKGNVAYVKYITDLEQLPDEEALQGYDAAFFENHALLILVETVNSGSVQLELENIRVNETTATVSLKRTMSGDAGTTDMATWMLWAEVEQGLDYTWCIKDRTQTTGGVKY